MGGESATARMRADWLGGRKVLKLFGMPSQAAGEKAPSDGRYRALLDSPSAISEQLSVQAVLVTSAESFPVRSVAPTLGVLGRWPHLHILEFDREANAPAIRIGTEVTRIGPRRR